MLGSLSKKTLFVFDANPSTVYGKELDQKIRKTMGGSEINSYESFLIFDLVPMRTTNPNDLPKSIDSWVLGKNLKIILRILSLLSEADVLLIWGGLIYKRDYLFECMRWICRKILKYPINFLRIGDLLKSGQPRHPLYAGYKLKFQHIDMKDYLKRLDA